MKKIAPLPIVRKVPKSRRALRPSTLSVYGVVMEDEEAGRWEVQRSALRDARG